MFALLSGARQNAFAKEDTGYANSDWEGVKFITNELFGDNSIATIENLYNFNDSPDYIYVEFGNGGYVVYFAETMEMMEYSLSGNLFERTDSGSKKYYAGPTEVYNKQGDVFKNLLSGQSFKVNSSNVDNVSKQIHDWFLLSPIERCQFPAERAVLGIIVEITEIIGIKAVRYAVFVLYYSFFEIAEIRRPALVFHHHRP